MNIKIQDFEGPLDLLLHLIQENKMDIMDIPIASITGQYLAVIRQWQEFDMTFASEFILMAARLLEIKSKMMLPKPRIEKEEEDSKEALEAQLIQYAAVKEIAAKMLEKEEETSRRIRKDPMYFPELEHKDDLIMDFDALSRHMRNLMERKREIKLENNHLKKENFTVEEKKDRIEELLKGKRVLPFEDVFIGNRPQDTEELCVSLMAVLELYKTEKLDFDQETLHGEIVISRKEEELYAG